MKISGLRYLVSQGVDNIWKNRIMAFASFCVLLVSLLLVGLSTLLYINLTSIIGGIESKNEVIVYIQDDATDEEIDKIGSALSAMNNISQVTFYSREEAFTDFKADMSEYDMLFDSLGDDNPLPDSYRIKIREVAEINDTLTQINRLDKIENIRAPYDFINVLTEVRKIITVVAAAIIISLVIVSMVIISNATRASVFARRREISIMKYVGATNAFIRIPFFVEGMLTGLMAGIVATLITWFTYDSLVDLMTKEQNLLSIIGMGNIIPFTDIWITVAVSYLVAGSFVGAIGSVISTRKHLQV